jgi:CheY-like chemotaxis protein
MAQSILFVDDEAPLGELMNSYLAGQGYDVTVALDGSEATALLEQRAFDIVMLDLHMPKVSGLEVLQYMKDRGIVTHCFIMSGDDRPYILELCHRFGVEGHLPKPFDFDDLGNILKQLRVP